MIRLVTLGTGTVTPHAQRTSACHYVEVSAVSSSAVSSSAVSSSVASSSAASPVRLLLDCGAGALHRMAQHGVPWRDLTHVGITHFHADHWGELGALIFAMKYGALEPRRDALSLIGPPGMKDKLQRLAGAFGDWVTDPGFPLQVIEITPGRGLMLGQGVNLAQHKTPHTDESIAYSVATPGERLVYTGDTGPSDELGDWARNCDLLLAECSLPESMAMDLHLTPRQAGRLAARAHAKRLVLTHLYPPVEKVDIIAEAAREFAGDIVIANDGDAFEC